MGFASVLPWAASAGAAGLGSLFGGGKGDKTSQLPNLSPEQSDFLRQLLGSLNIQDLDLGNNPAYNQGLSYLQNLLSGDTSEIEAPLMAQYENEILPGIAQRFGALGAQSSSGYQNALSSAGGDLAKNLGALRHQSKNSALDRILQYTGARQQGQQNLASLGLGTKPFGYQTQARGQGIGDILQYAGGLGLGSGLGRLFG
jgi:hypothetical protein